MTPGIRKARGAFLSLFRRDRRGSTVTLFAAVSPLLMLGMAVTADTVSWYNVRTKLQRAAETSALAAARQLTLANANPDTVVTVARNYANAHLASSSTVGATVDAQVIDNNSGVRVIVSRNVEPLLGRFYPENPVMVRASATGRVSGSANICAIALAATGADTFRFRKFSRMTAQGCAVYSNSTDPAGLAIKDSASITAALLCSAGGFSASAGASVNPKPTADCPTIADPLASRPEPAVGACTHQNLKISSGLVTLSPGVYCGGIKISKTANVTFLPGVYSILKGDLVATDTASVKGENVSFYFRSDDATNPARVKFAKSSTVDFSAPKDGPMAGFLLFESRTNIAADFQITSDNARNLLGTIYLPVSGLLLDGEQPVADRSAYTVVIARTIRLDAGPHLYLNANYGQTDIPVPAGVGPVGRVVRLGS